MCPRKPRADSDSRTTRASEQRTLTENRVHTDEQRLQSSMPQFGQSELPDIPPIPGFHVCWITTTNPRDSVVNRIKGGYELIRAEDVPGMEHSSIKTGEYSGCIGVNELLAAKIPLHLYERYMKEVHHDRPMQNADGIYQNIQDMQAAAQQVKGDVTVEPGFNSLKADQRIAQFDN